MRWLYMLHHYTAFPLRPFLKITGSTPPPPHSHLQVTTSKFCIMHITATNWATGGLISCDTVIYHSPVKHWPSVCISADGLLRKILDPVHMTSAWAIVDMCVFSITKHCQTDAKQVHIHASHTVRSSVCTEVNINLLQACCKPL